MRPQFNIHEVPRVVSLCHFVIYSPIFALGLINEMKIKGGMLVLQCVYFIILLVIFSHVLHGASFLSFAYFEGTVEGGGSR